MVKKTFGLIIICNNSNVIHTVEALVSNHNYDLKKASRAGRLQEQSPTEKVQVFVSKSLPYAKEIP